MKYILSFFVLFFTLGLAAQTEVDLKAYYSFDDCTATEMVGNGPNGTVLGNPSCVCGATGEAFKFNGTTDHILFLGVVNDHFKKDNFTLSFFFSPVNSAGTQTIISKKEDCDDLNAFAIRYTPQSRILTVELSENPSKQTILETTLGTTKCWNHVAIVRSGSVSSLYINGVLEVTENVVSRIDLTNNASLGIGEGPCVGITDNRFKGVIDELRVYNRALDDDEVLGLFEPIAPNNIVTSDTTIFIGNDIQIVSSSSCTDFYSWTPNLEMDDPSIPDPLISPTDSRVYTLSFTSNELGCTSQDSIRVTVLDPDNLDCTQIFLPKAFTPNNDGLNDTYGISNPYAITDLISFEIFDRWGGLVFTTTNPMDRWDGTAKGEALNPGVLLYKVRFRCRGEELIDAGSLTIIR